MEKNTVLLDLEKYNNLKEIENKYYSLKNNLDNCLQVNFFDTEEENCFCSEECFCKYMSLEQLDVEDDEDEI